jgi:Spy/CpxP family protein refolding chaperone
VVSWILGRVDATEAQQDEANRIVSETIGDLVPLVQEHRANRETLHAELGREILDESVLERVRSSEVALVDRASKELMEALVQFAAVLTPEQRAELHEMARRFHRR